MYYFSQFIPLSIVVLKIILSSIPFYFVLILHFYIYSYFFFCIFIVCLVIQIIFNGLSYCFFNCNLHFFFVFVALIVTFLYLYTFFVQGEATLFPVDDISPLICLKSFFFLIVLIPSSSKRMYLAPQENLLSLFMCLEYLISLL